MNGMRSCSWFYYHTRDRLFFSEVLEHGHGLCFKNIKKYSLRRQSLLQLNKELGSILFLGLHCLLFLNTLEKND